MMWWVWSSVAAASTGEGAVFAGLGGVCCALAVAPPVAWLAQVLYKRAVHANMHRQGAPIDAAGPGSGDRAVQVAQSPVPASPVVQTLQRARRTLGAAEWLSGALWGAFFYGSLAESMDRPQDLVGVLAFSGVGLFAGQRVMGHSLLHRVLGQVALVTVSTPTLALVKWLAGSPPGEARAALAVPVILAGAVVAAAMADNRWLRPFGSYAFAAVVPGAVTACVLAYLLLADGPQTWTLLTLLALPVALVAPLPLLRGVDRLGLISTPELLQRNWWLLATAGMGLFASLAVVGPEVLLGALFAQGGVVALVRAVRAHPTENRRLLLLRVFENDHARSLMRTLEASWSYTGRVELIAGTDMAHASVDVPELWAWLTGRLQDKAVSGPEDLQRRLAEQDRPPSASGRFAPMELFCANESWRGAMETLADRASVALMDLRGFQERHAGCLWELDRLFLRVHPEQVVLVTDKTTDLTLLHAHLDQVQSRHGGAVRILHDPDDSALIAACAAASDHAPAHAPVAPRPGARRTILAGAGVLALMTAAILAGLAAVG